MVNTQQVIKAIKKLKRHKHDGNTGLYTDHFKSAPYLLYELIADLFTSMLKHGHSPKQFSISTIISIPKNKRKSLTTSTNYRGIALSSILGKIFDWIILNTNGDQFKTTDMQFGFKADHSTSQCTYVCEEIINHYNKKQSDVYVVLLDASKAFDRVNHINLFKILMKKGVCPKYTKFILKSYLNQRIRTKWHHCHSETFNISNGVKQGGVLSPILFGIYLDELLLKLKKSGIGCHIGNIFTGALAYADDVVLLAPTKHAMSLMLKICSEFTKTFDLIFNADKNKFIHFPCSSSKSEKLQICFDGKTLTNTSIECHLGNIIGPNIMNSRIKRSTDDLYMRTNQLLSSFGFIKGNVKRKLFNSFCMAVYGSQLWDYSTNAPEAFYIAWRKCLRRIDGLPNKTHKIILPVLWDVKPIHVQLHKRFVNFVNKNAQTENEIIKICHNLTMQGSSSAVSNSVSHISFLYNISRHNVPTSRHSLQIDMPADDVVAVSACINQLLTLRNNVHLGNIPREDIISGIDLLCTE